MNSFFFGGVLDAHNGRQGKQIMPCHNSRTKLCTKLLNVEKQDNKTDDIDGMTDKRTNYRMPPPSA